MKIDIHNHFYPTRFLKQLEKDGPAVGISVEKDEWGRPIIVQHGNRVVTITPPMNDINQRLEDMDRAGFDMQILTLSIPASTSSPWRSVKPWPGWSTMRLPRSAVTIQITSWPLPPSPFWTPTERLKSSSAVSMNSTLWVPVLVQI